jgi:hypothetical protein
VRRIDADAVHGLDGEARSDPWLRAEVVNGVSDGGVRMGY